MLHELLLRKGLCLCSVIVLILVLFIVLLVSKIFIFFFGSLKIIILDYFLLFWIQNKHRHTTHSIVHSPLPSPHDRADDVSRTSIFDRRRCCHCCQSHCQTHSIPNKCHLVGAFTYNKSFRSLPWMHLRWASFNQQRWEHGSRTVVLWTHKRYIQIYLHEFCWHRTWLSSNHVPGAHFFPTFFSAGFCAD